MDGRGVRGSAEQVVGYVSDRDRFGLRLSTDAATWGSLRPCRSAPQTEPWGENLPLTRTARGRGGRTAFGTFIKYDGFAQFCFRAPLGAHFRGEGGGGRCHRVNLPGARVSSGFVSKLVSLERR